MHSVDGAGMHGYRAHVEHLSLRHLGAHTLRRTLRRLGFNLPREERADYRPGIACQVAHSALRNHTAAVRSGARPHLDDPIGMAQHLRVMVHQHHGIAIGHQIVHHAHQPLQVVGMQTDGRLVKHIEHPGRAVAHGAGQLHALTLAGRQRGSRAIERQVSQSEVHQAARRVEERIADVLCHRAHLGRQRLRHALDPLDGIVKRHRGRFVQPDAPQPRRPRGVAQTRAMAVRAHAVLQVFGDAFHAALVLDLGECVLDGVDGAVVGEVELPVLLRVLADVMDVLLDHRPVVDDLFLTVGQVAERHVGAHAHLAAHVRHERPDEAAPHDDGAFVDGLRLVGHECGFVDDVRDAGALADRAGAAAVEGEVLCPGRLDLRPAFGADDRLHGGDGEGGLDVMTVGASVAC